MQLFTPELTIHIAQYLDDITDIENMAHAGLLRSVIFHGRFDQKYVDTWAKKLDTLDLTNSVEPIVIDDRHEYKNIIINERVSVVWKGTDTLETIIFDTNAPMAYENLEVLFGGVSRNKSLKNVMCMCWTTYDSIISQYSQEAIFIRRKMLSRLIAVAIVIIAALIVTAVASIVCVNSNVSDNTPIITMSSYIAYIVFSILLSCRMIYLLFGQSRKLLDTKIMLESLTYVLSTTNTQNI